MPSKKSKEYIKDYLDDQKKKVDFSKIRYNLKDFFNDKEDKIKKECSMANEYSPFLAGSKKWETVTRLVTGHLDYSGYLNKKSKSKNFKMVKRFPFIYKMKKASLQKGF